MTRAIAYVIALAAALFAGWLVPALAMRALGPSLRASALTSSNYRGREVFLGLGLVWAVWAVALSATSTLFDIAASIWPAEYGSDAAVLTNSPLTVSLYAVPLILTLAAVVFGMTDDVFGNSADKGFRGHVTALLKGRLTTGGLKLLGIGVVSAVYGWVAVGSQPDAAAYSIGIRLAWWVVATFVIALAANLLNLLDLRPGRALKSYIVLVVPAAVLFGFAVVEQFGEYAEALGTGWLTSDTVVTIAGLLVVMLGPVAAVWGADLGERGMLGDAGSNAMGAIVGYLLAGALDLPSLAAVAVVLLALNALSERVSFSTLIEKAPVLKQLDGLGRLHDEQEDD